jgi:hypothetical protein
MSNEYEPTDAKLSAVVQQYINPESYKDFLKKENKLTRAIIASSTGLHDPNNYNPLVENNNIPDEYHLFFHNTSDNPTRINRFLADNNYLEKLKKYGWIKNDKLVDIEYRINRHGLRCNNFNDRESIIFVGCSHTYGTGVNEEDTWPKLVSDHFDYETINFGCPGLSSLIPTYHLLNCISKIEKPVAIILLGTPISRVDLIVETNNFLTFRPLRHWLIDDIPMRKHNMFMSASKLTSVMHHQLADTTLKNLSKNLNIPYLSMELGDLDLVENDIDFARDLMHFGVKTHSVIADKVISKLGTLGLQPKSDK